MSDPNWDKGHYYGGEFPKMGMKLARSDVLPQSSFESVHK